jgi:predicted NUDIX family NTP pyrophosphohydrolase
MPAKQSAGLLLYRHKSGVLEVLLGHPGGPFWAKRDAGAWSIPKGELNLGENPLEAAIREFEEETGYRPSGTFHPLAPARQAGGKVVQAWAIEGDFDPANLRSNTFSMEWPPRSGRMAEFPELDRVEWFSLDEAGRRILKGQAPFLAELSQLVAGLEDGSLEKAR